jgi:hypothetical protein
MAAKKDSSRRKKARAENAAEPPEMTVNEAAEVYPDQWVLMRVTGCNEYRMPWCGHILAASPDEREITAALGREPRPSELPAGVPPAHYYIFQAYPRVFGGEALQAVLARICGRRVADGQAAEG